MGSGYDSNSCSVACVAWKTCRMFKIDAFGNCDLYGKDCIKMFKNGDTIYENSCQNCEHNL